MTELEKLQDRLYDCSGRDRLSSYRKQQVKLEMESAVEYVKLFSRSGFVELLSLALLLQRMERKIDDLEIELNDLRRILDAS